MKTKTRVKRIERKIPLISAITEVLRTAKRGLRLKEVTQECKTIINDTSTNTVSATLSNMRLKGLVNNANRLWSLTPKDTTVKRIPKQSITPKPKSNELTIPLELLPMLSKLAQGEYITTGSLHADKVSVCGIIDDVMEAADLVDGLDNLHEIVEALEDVLEWS